MIARKHRDLVPVVLALYIAGSGFAHSDGSPVQIFLALVSLIAHIWATVYLLWWIFVGPRASK